MNLQPGDEVSIIGPASQLRTADKHVQPTNNCCRWRSPSLDRGVCTFRFV